MHRIDPDGYRDGCAFAPAPGGTFGRVCYFLCTSKEVEEELSDKIILITSRHWVCST
jgi:hypothetical protein